MTFLELCQRLRQEVGAAGTGPASVMGQIGEYARLISWVQQAWLEIQNKRPDWEFARARGEIETESGQRAYTLPGDWMNFIPDAISLDDRQLVLLPYAEFRRMQGAGSLSEPRYIAVAPRSGNSLHRDLYLDSPTTADQLLSFEYYRSPQRLSSNGNTPRLPEQHHMLIVYRAMLHYGMYESASEVIQRAALMDRRMMNEIERLYLPQVRMPEALA